MCVTSYWDDEIVQTTTVKAQETESSKKISRSLRVYEFKSRWRYSNLIIIMIYIAYILIFIGLFFTFVMFRMWQHWKNQDNVIKELEISEEDYNNYMKSILGKIFMCYSIAIVVKLFC